MLILIDNSIKDNGAGGRTRTVTPLRIQDFEYCASTNFTTPASKKMCHVSISGFPFQPEDGGRFVFSLGFKVDDGRG